MIITPTNTDVELSPGASYLCSALPRDDTPGSFADFYADNLDVIPRSEWRDMLGVHDYEAYARQLNTHITRQTMGSCASHATANIWERLHSESMGTIKAIQLSPLSLYKRVGRSPNSGSTLSANIREASTRGILPLDNEANRSKYDHVWPENEWGRSLPSGWESTAKLFQITEWFEARSFDEVFSALLYFLPVYYGRAGHAIMGAFPAYENGTFGIGYENSWGSSWGDGGYGFDTERFVSGSFSGYGCFIPRLAKRLT